MTRTVPSIASLESNDDGQLIAELRTAELREQLALVRTLADHIDNLLRPSDIKGASEQLFEEMARLGCRLFETAISLAGSHPEPTRGASDGSHTQPVAEPCSRGSSMA